MAISFADLRFHATFKNKLYSHETDNHFEIEKPLLNLQNETLISKSSPMKMKSNEGSMWPFKNKLFSHENKNIHPRYYSSDLNFIGQM